MSDNKIPRVLYISYDGMLEPLGQSQVLQYLRRLAHLLFHIVIDVSVISSGSNEKNQI